ncbi:MAG TPA: hypothetical protein VFS92_02005 [Planctomycetota bacterium]|nr:hypothetical protein [Planctomycetota bacterium]
MRRSRAAVLAAILAAACASTTTGRRAASPPDPAAPERAADDAALAAAAAELAPLEEHFAAVAGGRFLGGAMLLEDAARLVQEAGPGIRHAYLFRVGSQGDRRVPIPALYGDRVAGAALLDALGLRAELDAAAGRLAIRRGSDTAEFGLRDGVAAASFVVAAASGRGTPWTLPLAVSPGFAGTAIVSREDAASLGLALSEIPGEATLVEGLTGRPVPHRRALCRVSFPFGEDAAAPAPSALVEVLFPK